MATRRLTSYIYMLWNYLLLSQEAYDWHCVHIIPCQPLAKMVRKILEPPCCKSTPSHCRGGQSLSHNSYLCKWLFWQWSISKKYGDCIFWLAQPLKSVIGIVWTRHFAAAELLWANSRTKLTGLGSCNLHASVLLSFKVQEVRRLSGRLLCFH